MSSLLLCARVLNDLQHLLILRWHGAVCLREMLHRYCGSHMFAYNTSLSVDAPRLSVRCDGLDRLEVTSR